MFWSASSVEERQIVEAETALALHCVIDGDDVVDSRNKADDSDYKKHENTAQFGVESFQNNSYYAKTKPDEKQNKRGNNDFPMFSHFRMTIPF